MSVNSVFEETHIRGYKGEGGLGNKWIFTQNVFQGQKILLISTFRPLYLLDWMYNKIKPSIISHDLNGASCLSYLFVMSIR